MGGHLPVDNGRVGRLLCPQVGIQRNLGVHGQVRAIGESDADVGADAYAVMVHTRGLLLVVAVGRHARELDDIPQLVLTPRPPGARGSEGLAEAGRGGTQFGDLTTQLAGHGVHRALVLLVGRPEVTHGLLELAHLQLERVQQPFRLFVDGTHAFGCQGQELVVVGLQCRGCGLTYL